MHPSDKYTSSNAQTQINNIKELIKKIQSSPNYLKLHKYPDNMTYECLLWEIVELDAIPLIPQEETIEIDEPFGSYKQPPMPYDQVEHDVAVDEMTGIMHELKKPVDFDQLKQQFFGNCELKYSNINKKTPMPYDGPEDEMNNLKSPDYFKKPTPNHLGPEYWKPIIHNQQLSSSSSIYYDFKYTRGISSTQTIYKEPKHKTITKLSGGVWEQKIHTFNNTQCDAITDIKLLMTNTGLQNEQVEFILRVGGNTLFSKTFIIPDNTLVCNFIDFPNLITNHPKNRSNKVEIYMRMNYYLTGNDTISFTINYDAILFDSASRSKIFKSTKPDIFETTSGIVCMGNEGFYAVRYMTQLIDSIDPNFEHLYKIENSGNNHQENKNNHQETQELNENIKIIL